MNNKRNRILSFILALLMLAPLSSCANEIQTNETDTTAQTVDAAGNGEAAVETKEDDPFEGLETANLDGMNFTFLTSNWPGEAPWTVDDISAEEYTGSPINDAVYDRNIAVEERLNCNILEAQMAGSSDAVNALTISVSASDNAYQVWVPRLQEYLSMASQGYIMDMNQVAGINFDSKSWVQNSRDGLSIMGYHFAVCNEMVTIHKEATSCIVFNKNLAEINQLPDLYDVVLDGKWTLEYFSQVVEQVSRDLNGDGVMNQNDLFGFLYQRDTLDAFLAAGGEAICKKDESDKPVYSFDSERAISLLMDVTDLIYNKEICYNSMNYTAGDFNEWMMNKVMSDESMFAWVRTVNIPTLRQMESDFGILPNPMYTEDMDTYYTVVNSFTGAAISVPNIVDADVAQYLGLFLETMGAASLNTLSKAYYDTLLNGIVVRDEESQDMLDIIFANTTYDPGSIGKYGGIQDYIYMVMNYVQNFASYNAGKKRSVETAIEKMCDQIQKKFGAE